MTSEYDLSWGDPIVVRQALSKTVKDSYGTCYWDSNSLLDLTYPPHFGTSQLIKLTKELAKRQSGHRPKHLILTCGATGAINAALHALKTQRTDWVVTNKRRFPLYPAIIQLTDMIMIDKDKRKELCNASNGCSDENFVSLVDSPSAPEGLISTFEDADIWDAAYASYTYSNKQLSTPNTWKIMCGSFSKTLGLAGLRLGWASTDEDLLADSIKNYVNATYAGLSSASMEIAEKVMLELNLDSFELLSSSYLDDNREEIQKLITKFGQGDVPNKGMFVILELGKSEKRALERAKVKWLPGSIWGETDDWARLSLGQDREVTRCAVKAALK